MSSSQQLRTQRTSTTTTTFQNSRYVPCMVAGTAGRHAEARVRVVGA